MVVVFVQLLARDLPVVKVVVMLLLLLLLKCAACVCLCSIV